MIIKLFISQFVMYYSKDSIILQRWKKIISQAKCLNYLIGNQTEVGEVLFFFEIQLFINILLNYCFQAIM
jgi:hypothetical protein